MGRILICLVFLEKMEVEKTIIGLCAVCELSIVLVEKRETLTVNNNKKKDVWC